MSGKDRGKPDRARQADSPKGSASPEKKTRKQRPADVGRALRSGVALAALKMTMPGDLALITPSELDDALALLDQPGLDIHR